MPARSASAAAAAAPVPQGIRKPIVPGGAGAAGRGLRLSVSRTSRALDARHAVAGHDFDVEHQRQAPRGHVVDLIGQPRLAAAVLLLEERLVHLDVGIEQVARQPSGGLRQRDDQRARPASAGCRTGTLPPPASPRCPARRASRASRATRAGSLPGGIRYSRVPFCPSAIALRRYSRKSRSSRSRLLRGGRRRRHAPR